MIKSTISQAKDSDRLAVTMGVYGLMSHCLEHRKDCAQTVDLVDIARQRGGIEILVDFYSFEHLLVASFWKSLTQVTRNPYLRVYGGEYTSLKNYVSKIITDLRSLDIHLVMFIDGSKGSSQVGTKQKLDTWKFRHRKDVEKLRDLMDVLKGNHSIHDVSESAFVRPVLLEVQVIQTLKECKCEIVQCSTGEADFVIARNLQSREKAFAVLSNDSDFCVFASCKFIPNDLFDLEHDLQLGGEHLLPEKPLRLLVGILSTSRVADSLGVRLR